VAALGGAVMLGHSWPSSCGACENRILPPTQRITLALIRPTPTSRAQLTLHNHGRAGSRRRGFAMNVYYARIAQRRRRQEHLDGASCSLRPCRRLPLSGIRRRSPGARVTLWHSLRGQGGPALQSATRGIERAVTFAAVEGYEWVFIDTAPTTWVVVQEAIFAPHPRAHPGAARTLRSEFRARDHRRCARARQAVRGGAQCRAGSSGGEGMTGACPGTRRARCRQDSGLVRTDQPARSVCADTRGRCERLGGPSPKLCCLAGRDRAPVVGGGPARSKRSTRLMPLRRGDQAALVGSRAGIPGFCLRSVQLRGA